MDLNNISLINMLQEKMKYSAARQEVISQNIANVDTPGFKRKDITQPNFGNMVKDHMVALETTDPKHIGGSKSSGIYLAKDTGSTVELDMEALELMKNNNEFSKASTTFKKIISLLNQAIGSSAR